MINKHGFDDGCSNSAETCQWCNLLITLLTHYVMTTVLDLNPPFQLVFPPKIFMKICISTLLTNRMLSDISAQMLIKLIDQPHKWQSVSRKA